MFVLFCTFLALMTRVMRTMLDPAATKNSRRRKGTKVLVATGNSSSSEQAFRETFMANPDPDKSFMVMFYLLLVLETVGLQLFSLSTALAPAAGKLKMGPYISYHNSV